MEIEVKGHSGCQIDVVREDGQLYVYKSSRDPKYLARLVLQAEKQHRAALPELQHIRVPKVHAIDRSDGYPAAALIMYLEREIKDSPLAVVPRSVVTDKFADVRAKTLANKSFEGDGEIGAMMDASQRVFDALTDMLIPVGTCHGDLTFSNILFNGNNYYLIDFLDSFIESPLLDIVKLRQDTAWLWSQLMYVHPCDTIRLRIAFGKIDAELDNYFASRYEWYGRYYRPLQLMNFLRILQYAHEPAVIDYLKQAINEQLKEF